ncbi:MAG: mono/diheme cytochrome c family protein [Flavobacteriaceae bacterium]|jgi:mono/diheme cytochrome c family protein|tara:strand:+ start:230 stop:643 length:414 start_codon:yes stop_codon:yes gene_type:complete
MKSLVLGFLLITGIITSYLFQEKTKKESIKLGSEIYQDFCVQCHLSSGQGVAGVFPPLKGSDYLYENIDLSIAGIKHGLRGEIIVNGLEYDGVMAKQGLDDDEIADVMNYILNQWGNQTEVFITPQQVSKIPKSLIE